MSDKTLPDLSQQPRMKRHVANEQTAAGGERSSLRDINTPVTLHVLQVEVEYRIPVTLYALQADVECFETICYEWEVKPRTVVDSFSTGLKRKDF